MTCRPLISTALLSLIVFSSAGCSAIQGELVETGMSDTTIIDLEPAERSGTESELVGGNSSAAGNSVVNSDSTDNGNSTAGSDSVINSDSAPNSTADDATAETRGSLPVSVDEVLQVRPVSGFSPEWSTKPEAFDFIAPELFSGAPLVGAEIYRSGSALVTFVSPGCVVSVQDGPAYARVADANPLVTFLFVHTDGSADTFQQFVEEADLFQENVIHINDADLTLWNRFGITTQPSTVLVDRDGRASVTEGGLGHEGLTIAVGLLGAAY
ncbi:MAG: hypothetical protein ACI8TP_001164 [Acidimicrobiales bacterium]